MGFQHLHSAAAQFISVFVVIYLLLRFRRQVPPEPLAFSLKAFTAGVVGQCLADIPAWYGYDRLADAVAGVSIFLEGVAFITLVGQAMLRSVIPALGLHPPRILHDVCVAILTVIWGMYHLQANGVNLTGIIATSAVLTGVIGFAMQDTLGNVLAGLALEVDGSVRVGDWVKVDDLSGRVLETTWRYTAIETRNWETILVPNSQLVKNRVMLLGQRQGEPVQWRRWVWFNVDYRFPPTRVLETVAAALAGASLPRVAKTPAPNVLLMDFQESWCRYAVRYWLTDLAVDDPTDSAVRTVVAAALHRNGISLSIPAHAVFMTKLTEERKANLAGQTQRERHKMLKRIDLFQNLQEEELAHLAGNLVESPFMAGEVMTRQGAEAHWLYILAEGRADVSVAPKDGEPVKVAELVPGNFFGEWSLLTGEPRHATVVATAPVLAYRLDREIFRQVLEMRPALTEEISGILARRRSETDGVLEKLDATTRATRLVASKSSIMSKIRGFFGLDQPEV